METQNHNISKRTIKNPLRTIFRHGEIHEKAIEHAMELNLSDKSEALRMIVEEWLYYVAGK